MFPHDDPEPEVHSMFDEDLDVELFWSGNYPSAWSEGIITPVLNGGSPDDCKTIEVYH